jgi:alpha-ribazole phosphatase
MSSSQSMQNNDAKQITLPLKHTIYLLRHGDVNVEANICYGQLDCELTASFDADLNRSSEFFKDKLVNNTTEIMTSPLSRCSILAKGLATALSASAEQTKNSHHCKNTHIQQNAHAQQNTDKTVTLTEQPAFQEINFGEWEGQSWDKIGQQNIEAWSQNLLDYTFPSGESARQFHQRVVQQWQTLCEQLAQSEETKTVIIICHAGVVRSILADFLQIPLAHALTLQIDKLSVSTIKLVPTQPALSRCISMNHKI